MYVHVSVRLQKTQTSDRYTVTQISHFNRNTDKISSLFPLIIMKKKINPFISEEMHPSVKLLLYYIYIYDILRLYCKNINNNIITRWSYSYIHKPKF